MKTQCPTCKRMYEVASSALGQKAQCSQCGEKFMIAAYEEAPVAPEESVLLLGAPTNVATVRDFHDSLSERTMPGLRIRKQNGHFEVGDLIINRYQVLSELGQGGMGVVYKCFDQTAGIEVALKALPPELSHNKLEMEDIKENFQLVHNLHHPNIASYNNLEFDRATGNYYLIMECVSGEDLRRWLKCQRKENALTLAKILPLIRQIATALDYAHGQKIIHRDIKPGNVMLESGGTVKLLDFGLAAQIHTSLTRVSMGYHGTSGTGPYMAPEQWKGQPQGFAADQYALAVLTYEMLAGHLPFESPDVSVLREAVLNENYPELADCAPTVNQALARAMSKDPAVRFESCLAFVEALGNAPSAAVTPEAPMSTPVKANESQAATSASQIHDAIPPQSSAMVATALTTGNTLFVKRFHTLLISRGIFLIVTAILGIILFCIFKMPIESSSCTVTPEFRFYNLLLATYVLFDGVMVFRAALSTTKKMRFLFIANAVLQLLLGIFYCGISMSGYNIISIIELKLLTFSVFYLQGGIQCLVLPVIPKRKLLLISGILLCIPGFFELLDSIEFCALGEVVLPPLVEECFFAFTTLSGILMLIDGLRHRKD